MAGLAYQLALSAGVLWLLGPAMGIARAVLLTAFAVGAYFLGVARAEGHLRGAAWGLALSALVAVVGFNLSNLFLVGAVTFVGSALLGFVITSRRVPWATLVLFFVVLSVFQNGKETMRRRYWVGGADTAEIASPTQIPSRIWEWFLAGIKESSGTEERAGVLERSSLIQMLLRAQRFTPAYIDYLRGESYATIPWMLVPRVVAENKIASQAGLDLLNRRYGLVSFEGRAESAITWGLIAEAWANFGFYGEFGIGLLVGLFSGPLTRWSVGAAAVSRATLYSVAAMLGLINASDGASVVVVLWQAFVAILVTFWIFRLFASRTLVATSTSSVAALRPRPGD